MTEEQEFRNPPRILEQLLKLLYPDRHRFTPTGDFAEMYNTILIKRSKSAAIFWYLFQLLKCIPSLFRNKLYWGKEMFKNYLKISVRNIRKHKAYSFINIAGLSVSLVACVFIFLYVNVEINYEEHIPDADRVYRIATILNTESGELRMAKTLAPMATTIKDKLPELEQVTRVLKPWWGYTFEKDNSFIREREGLLVDNEFFEIFDTEFIMGSPEEALTRPGTIVITEKFALKYFNTTDVVGKTLKMGEEKLEITGVVKNSPDNTHIKYDFLFPAKVLENYWDLNKWGWVLFYVYIKTHPGSDINAVGENIASVTEPYLTEHHQGTNRKTSFILQPLKSIHLDSHLEQEIEEPGSREYVAGFTIIGGLILIIACINFINLTTARSSTRLKEIGLRKISGATRRQLVYQVLSESIIITMISAILAAGLIFLLLNKFNTLTGLRYRPDDLQSPLHLICFLAAVLSIGFMAGIYPALSFSLYSPAQIMRKMSRSGKGNFISRRILVIVQFSFAVFLVFVTLSVQDQIDFMREKPLGFDEAGQLIIWPEMSGNYEELKNEFLQHPAVIKSSASWSAPGYIADGYTTKLVNSDFGYEQGMSYHYFDHDFIPQYDIKMIAGRNFLQSDSNDKFILNRAATTALGFEDPSDAIGRQMYEGGSSVTGDIIGVTEDFHYKGIQNLIEPLVMQKREKRFGSITLTLKAGEIPAALEFIENKWNELNLGNNFEYSFLDDHFNSLYGKEEKTAGYLVYFTLFALFISCIGLMGLAAFSAEQRRKEIGIRKVLGASSVNAVSLLSKEYSVWGLIASIIALPVGYLVVQQWLDYFAYKTVIGPWLFLLSFLLIFVLSLAIVVFQSYRAAVTNPVETLRSE